MTRTSPMTFERFFHGSLRAIAACALFALCLAVPVQHAAAAKVKIKGEIVTAEDINPNLQGRPSPVRLILFQLTSEEAFENADYFSLYDEDSGVLDGDLLGRSDQMLRPGQSIEFEEEFDEEMTFLGVVVAFRDLEQSQWRDYVEVEARGFFSLRRSSKVLIELESQSVTVTVE